MEAEASNMGAVIYSLLSGEAKVVGTNCPETAKFLRALIAQEGLDATVKLVNASELPDLASTYPYDN